MRRSHTPVRLSPVTLGRKQLNFHDRGEHSSKVPGTASHTLPPRRTTDARAQPRRARTTIVARERRLPPRPKTHAGTAAVNFALWSRLRAPTEVPQKQKTSQKPHRQRRRRRRPRPRASFRPKNTRENRFLPEGVEGAAAHTYIDLRIDAKKSHLENFSPEFDFGGGGGSKFSKISSAVGPTAPT